MKLEDQVVSLELAKRLKELSVKQESLFRWRPDRPQQINPSPSYLKGTQWELDYAPPSPDDIAAFTVAELGEMLSDYRLEDWKTASGFEWVTATWIRDRHTFVGSTEADARAKMLIYLIENGLYAPKE